MTCIIFLQQKKIIKETHILTEIQKKNWKTLPSTPAVDISCNCCVNAAVSSSDTICLAVSCSSVCFFLAPVCPPLCSLFPPEKRTYNSINDLFC